MQFANAIAKQRYRLIIALNRSILPITLTGTHCSLSSLSGIIFLYHQQTIEYYPAQVTTILIAIVAMMNSYQPNKKKNTPKHIPMKTQID
jgi:hypothetical protein